MPAKGIRSLFLTIILPAIMAMILYFIAVYAVYIPLFERSMMNSKKEMINELTNTAWSLIREYDEEYNNALITIDEAKQLARTKINKMRYGSDGKDYFWIIDTIPTMIMHPYRPELNFTNLSDYKDPEGKHLFVDAVELVKQNNEGYIHYIWQSNDDSTRLVPKLSYVKGYESWGWIIGTGVYLDDVEEEIDYLKNRLVKISLIILLLVALILAFIIRQSLKIENRRKETEEKLRLSREKYRSLVAASTEGTLMIIDEKIVFSNHIFNQKSGYASDEIITKSFNELFEISWQEVADLIEQQNQSVAMETLLKQRDGKVSDIIISVSKVPYAGRDGYIVVVRDVSKNRQIEKETDMLTAELQTTLLLMNQPIRDFVRPFVQCTLDTTVGEAAALMTRNRQHIIFIAENNRIIGVLNDSDLRVRVLAKGMDAAVRVAEVMTAPVIAIEEDALLYEVILMLRQHATSHLAVKNRKGAIIGIISNRDVITMQHNALSYILREIEQASGVEEIKKIYFKVPVLVRALLESGDKTPLITRINTSVADAITNRLISLAIEEMGAPPCRFAFIALGSEGRMEQTMATDQDNAIIFEDLNEEMEEEAQAWLLKFAERINENLAAVGYELCKGNVMARNPQWTRPLKQWKTLFSRWIKDPEPQYLLDSVIFFDFRTIFGDETFAVDLRKHINESIGNKSIFLYHYAQTIIRYRAPVSMFGSIVSDDTGSNDTFDIKRVLLPITNFVKLYALKNKLSETNTLHRLEQLTAKGEIQQALYNEVALAHNYLMGLRFRTQIRALNENRKPNNHIEINLLTDIEKSTLKKIFSVIADIQSKLSADFK